MGSSSDCDSKSHKARLQKQASHSQLTSPKSPFKSKRSQSIPSVSSPKMTISCTKSTMSSSNLPETCYTKDESSEDTSLLSPDTPPSDLFQEF
ncbi:hypothetical protein CEXT_213851 [Caerostris extrusa]|uniref:Uncharacterized protein n=1 Tax=Caerostris extrusa TaxID=172846 RepID=A0AAV4V4N1_CAEEX|nr:hypothetical protein CEXT_213851 [Caerostris extrusa]